MGIYTNSKTEIIEKVAHEAKELLEQGTEYPIVMQHMLKEAETELKLREYRELKLSELAALTDINSEAFEQVLKERDLRKEALVMVVDELPSIRKPE